MDTLGDYNSTTKTVLLKILTLTAILKWAEHDRQIFWLFLQVDLQLSDRMSDAQKLTVSCQHITVTMDLFLNYAF